MKNHSCDRKYSSFDAHSTPCNIMNISCPMMKYTHVTKKLTVTGRIIFITEGVFPVKERQFLEAGNSFPVTGIKKEHFVSQYILPVNQNISCHRK